MTSDDLLFHECMQTSPETATEECCDLSLIYSREDALARWQPPVVGQQQPYARFSSTSPTGSTAFLITDLLKIKTEAQVTRI